MQTTIRLSKGFVFLLISLILGIYFLVCGITSLQKEKNAINLSEINIENCANGVYVSGNIHSYLVKGRTAGISQTLLSGLKEYNLFTIPVDDNQFIRVMIAERDTLKGMENLRRNSTEGIYFEGKIIKSPVDIPYTWYEDVSGGKEFRVENVIRDFVIIETKFSYNLQKLAFGIVLLVISFLTYLLIGKMPGIIEKDPMTEKPCLYSWHGSYNMEYNLMIEERHLSALQKRLYDLKIGCLFRIPILLLGVFIAYTGYYEMKLLGLMISILTIKGFARYLLNIGWKSTDWVLGLVGKKSIARQIDECTEKINKTKDIITGY